MVVSAFLQIQIVLSLDFYQFFVGIIYGLPDDGIGSVADLFVTFDLLSGYRNEQSGCCSLWTTRFIFFAVDAQRAAFVAAVALFISFCEKP